MWRRRADSQRQSKCEQGQSLIETAITLPILLGLAFNIINLGYMWFLVLSLSTAPRYGVQYASQGGQAVTTVTAPTATAVSNLVYENLTNTIGGATISNAAVQVCTATLGTNASGIASCQQFGPAFAFPSPAADPEAPIFVLNRVDVEYTVTPLIPGPAFNVVLPANLKFHRQVSMRSLF